MIRYGPLERTRRRNSALSGSTSSYSTGAAEAKCSARMCRKSTAGRIRSNTIVRSSTARTPAISWLFWNAASSAAVGSAEVIAASYASQYSAIPRMVLVK